MLSDSEFKAEIQQWPQTTTKLFKTLGEGVWIKARPSNEVAPQIWMVGDAAKVHPDGLYLFLVKDNNVCDAICFECCTSEINFKSSRAKYLVEHQNLQIDLPGSWLEAEIPTMGLGGPMKSRAEIVGVRNPERRSVRFLKVVYFLSKEVFQRVAHANLGRSYEYFTSNSPNISAVPMQTFLKGVSPASHYLGKWSYTNA